MPRIERWKPVVGYETLFEVSDQGRVHTLPKVLAYAKGGKFGGKVVAHRVKSRILKFALDRNGYQYVCLWGVREDGKSIHKYVHILVLEAFIGPRPEGMETRHFPDRNPLNNCLSNLSWGTPKENGQDRVVHGTSGKGRVFTEEWRARLSASSRWKGGRKAAAS